MKISLTKNISYPLLINSKKAINQSFPMQKDTFISSNISFGDKNKEGRTFQDDLYEFLYMVADNPQRYIQKRNIYNRTSIQEFCAYLNEILPHSKQIADLLTEKSFSKATQLFTLGSIYKHKSVQNAFAYQEENFLEVYSLLKNKNHLSSYPLLLAHLYNEESAKENPDFSKLEKYPEFLSEIQIKNDEQISQCFSVLKSRFNDLKTVSDVVDLIDYLIETHPKKMELLDEILKQRPETAKFSPNYVYSMLSDAVDMHFILNNGESLEPMQDYISSAVQMPQLKPKNVEIISETFNAFDEVTDVIDFFKFLAISEISVKEFNAINSKTPVLGFDLVKAVENISFLPPIISQLSGMKSNEARLFYIKNADLINSVYDEKNPDTSSLELLLNAMKSYDIKDSSSFLSLYNRVFSTKEKHIDSEHIIKLSELLSYSTKDELKCSRKLNITEFELLSKNKQTFQNIEESIKKFILDDESNFFAGMTPLEVFNKFKSSFIDSSESVNNILSNIVDLNISNSKDYAEKISQINKFAPYFSDRKSLLAFMSDNQIDFESSRESIDYKNNCLKILEALYDENNKAESILAIEKLSKSKFLQKSIASLGYFIPLFEDKNKLKDALNIIIQRKIPSVNSLETFYKKFKTKDSSLPDMINHIAAFPEKINFNSYKRIINSVQKMINNLNVPVVLSLDNMSKVSPNDYITLTEKSLPEFLNKLVNSEDDKSFLLGLNNAKTKESQTYTRFKIAYELVKHLEDDDKCYNSLLKKMRLDKDYLFHNQDVKEKVFIDTIAKYFPSELYEFINSNDWCELSSNKDFVPELSLHTKLRVIARFIVPNLNMIEDIAKPEHKNTVRKLLSTVFEQVPSSIIKGNNKNTFKLIYDYQGRRLHTVFDRSGKIATIYLR